MNDTVVIPDPATKPVIPDPAVKPFSSPGEVAGAMDLNIKTVLAAIKANEIPATRVGRKLLVPTAWLAAQARSAETTGDAA